MCGLIMKRAYSWKLNSLIVAKSRTFIENFSEIYEKLDTVKPFTRNNTKTLRSLESLNDTKSKVILSKTEIYQSSESFMNEKFGDLMKGKAVLISSTRDINRLMKIYPDSDLKLVEVRFDEINFEYQAFRFPVSKNSAKFEKIFKL